jgi:hypothetical protein
MRVEEKGGKHLMKVLTGAVLALLFALARPPIANVAEIEPFGFVSAMGGAERETGQPSGGVGRAGGRATLGALGVLPFVWQNFGLQGSVSYVGGQGSRFGVSAGPLFGWAGGKSGILIDYQHRTLRSSDFFWISPVLALYFDQLNVNLSYSQPISPIQRKTRLDFDPDHDGDPCKNCSDIIGSNERRDVPVNRLQASVSYFPAIIMPFVTKDNLELTFGVQVNTFAGPMKDLRGAGVGPVFGVAVMPWQNLEVTLLKASFDNRSRYNVQSGLSFFFPTTATASNSLMQLRRRYIQVTPMVSGAGPYTHAAINTRCFPGCD